MTSSTNFARNFEKKVIFRKDYPNIYGNKIYKMTPNLKEQTPLSSPHLQLRVCTPLPPVGMKYDLYNHYPLVNKRFRA